MLNQHKPTHFCACGWHVLGGITLRLEDDTFARMIYPIYPWGFALEITKAYCNILQLSLWWACLVGGFNPSEKYESVGMIIPNIWKNRTHVPNHQPAARPAPPQTWWHGDKKVNMTWDRTWCEILLSPQAMERSMDFCNSLSTCSGSTSAAWMRHLSPAYMKLGNFAGLGSSSSRKINHVSLAYIGQSTQKLYKWDYLILWYLI